MSLVHRRVVEVPVNPPFPLGQVVATPAALKLVPPEVLRQWLHRHQTGDWGAVGPEDWAANDRALTGQGAGSPVTLTLQPDPNVQAKFWRVRVRG